MGVAVTLHGTKKFRKYFASFFFFLMNERGEGRGRGRPYVTNPPGRDLIGATLVRECWIEP